VVVAQTVEVVGREEGGVVDGAGVVYGGYDGVVFFGDFGVVDVD